MKLILLFFFFIGIISDTTTNEKKVWNFLKSKSLTNAGAAGLMGNLYFDSRIESVIYEEKYHETIGLTNEEYVLKVNSGEYTNFVNDNAGFGLAQWRDSSRKQALLNKCPANIGDMDCQLEFLYNELEQDFPQVLNFLKSSNDIYSCIVEVMVNFENPSDQSDEAKNDRKSFSEKYYNAFIKDYSYIWNYLIYSDYSQYGTAALMGNFYGESEMESGAYDIDFHTNIGLTNEEYVNSVNNGTYKNFENDNAGFGIVQWNSNSSKSKLLNKCKGTIGDFICQLNFLLEDLDSNYNSLNEMLKTCVDLKYCTTQFYLIYNNNLKDKTEEKQDLRYLYAKEYMNTLSKKCGSNKFFGARNKECNDFPIVPNDCRFARLDKYKDGSYSLFCQNPLEFKCNQNFYSLVENFNQTCIPLSPEDIVSGCVHYSKTLKSNYPVEEWILKCKACDKQYYLYENTSICLNIQKEIEHCRSYIFYSYETEYSCQECEFGYHYKKGICYKIPYKIENCELYEVFYNNEFSCLKTETETDEIEKKEENSFDSSLFYKHLYLLFLYLLL